MNDATPKLTRRALLRGAGGAALALPLLSSLDARAQTAAFPKRILFVYTPNGNVFLPQSMNFQGSILEPLQPWASKLVVINGLDLSAHESGPGEPHQRGMAMLTGRRLNSGTMVGGDGSTAGWGSGISIDQHIANTLGVGTRFKTLNVGVQSTRYVGTDVRTVLSYTGSNQPVANETSPYNLYTRVFSQLGADPFGLDRQRQRRHATLDYVKDRFAAVNGKLSGEDRVKLERHLDGVRDIESRLDAPMAAVGAACSRPATGNPVNVDEPASFPQLGRLFMDQLVMAFACDLTRVATLQWSAATNNRPYPWLQYDDGTGLKAIADDEHILGHNPDSNVHAWGKLRVIRRWYMEQLAYLLGKLAAVPEGGGTLLDNTVVVMTSELSKGSTHSLRDVPFILAGGAGGRLAGNRYLTYGNTPHNNLWVSLMNAMGVPGTTFGDPAFCTGPLPGLV